MHGALIRLTQEHEEAMPRFEPRQSPDLCCLPVENGQLGGIEEDSFLGLGTWHDRWSFIEIGPWEGEHWVSFWPGQICGPRSPSRGPLFSICACPRQAEILIWSSRERSKLDIHIGVISILKRETCNPFSPHKAHVIHSYNVCLLAPQLHSELPKEKTAFSILFAGVIWKRELEFPLLDKME